MLLWLYWATPRRAAEVPSIRSNCEPQNDGETWLIKVSHVLVVIWLCSEDKMADGIRITAVTADEETTDKTRDSRIFSGTVSIAVVYGDITLIVPIPFVGKTSHKETACDALRRLEDLGHFIESQGRLARHEYKCTE